VPPGSGRAGYLLWARDTELLARPFDAASGRLNGQAERIITDVLVDESQRGLMAAASHTGTLLWASARADLLQFAWYDRSGRRVSTIPIDPGHLYQPRLSRDARSLLFYRADKGGADVWLHVLVDGTTRRLTNEPGYNQSPAWLPDGRGVVYVADSGLKRIGLDESTAQTISGAWSLEPPTVTPDGRFVIAGGKASGPEPLWAFGVAAPHALTPLAPDRGTATNTLVSPDGRWLLWRLTNGDRQDLLLSRLITDGATPRLGAERLAIAPGGGEPLGWRGDGRELYYLERGREVMAVAFESRGDTATVGPPVKLFAIPGVPTGTDSTVAPTDDGSRFVVTEAPFARGQGLRVLTGWEKRLGR